MKKYGFSLIVACCCSLSVLSAQNNNIAINRLTIDDGLSQGMIFDILQTKDGFIWVGTKDGLNRYDGYRFRSWNNDPANSYSLADNSITALFEDSRGWLWVGTESQGLHLFDRRSSRFYHFTMPIALKRGSQALYDIRQIEEDKDGHIWIVNRGGGVFKLTIPGQWSKSLPNRPDLGVLTTIRPLHFPVQDTIGKGVSEEFQAICVIGANRILVGSSHTLYEVNTRSLFVKQLPMPESIGKGAVDLEVTGDGTIWGVNKSAVFFYKNGRFVSSSFPREFVSDISTCLKIDNKGQIWVLFDTGLWKFASSSYFQIGEPDYHVDKFSNAMLPDDQGNIWIGTSGYGLRIVTPRKALFNACLKGESIWGMWQSRNKDTYVKIFNKIYNYDLITRQLSTTLAFPDALPQQNDMVFEPNGNFWLLSGLREKDINVTELRHYRSDKTLIAVYPIELERYAHARLMYAKDGTVWVSGVSGQLLRLDTATGKAISYNLGALFGKDALSVLVYALAEDGKGNIWAGTQLGLVRCIRNGDRLDFKLYKTETSGKRSLSNNSVICLLPDPKAPGRILWIGTKGGGINRLDILNDEFSYITTEEGLPNNVVYGILPDEEGSLWCSTNRGLCQVFLQNSHVSGITNYTAGDGLQSNEFNTQAFFKAPGGELFFGGVDGMNHFQPGRLKFLSKVPNVFIVGLEINNKPLWFDAATNTAIEYVTQLTLQHSDNNLSFEFAAMDFTDPQKNQYKYQLLPIEKEWITSKEGHKAHYTHLSPGSYRFRVMGSNSAGVWSKQPSEMEIVIHPPWWASTMAYFAYTLTVVLIVLYLYRAQIRNIRLTAQVAYEQRELERVKEVEQMKSNFFSNITHEFRTPITLILEPLRQILNNPKQEGLLSKVRLAERNSRKLLALVNQLLDLAKLESGAMKAEYRLMRAGDVVRAVVQSFEPAIQNKGLSLTYSAAGDMVMGEFDQDKLEKIISNLLSNALKFTPAGGNITVACEVKAGEPGKSGLPTNGYLYLKVSDTGQGISAGDLPHIFERFYQSADESRQELQAGTGIGLALCRELTELMGGRITAESEWGKGATFHLWIPLRAASAGKAPAAEPRQEIVHYVPSDEPVASSFQSPQFSQGRALVLLAEDNEELRVFLQQTLSDKYEVLTASDGAEAVETAREKIPDIIVSDLVMPQLDGIGLLDVLKQDIVTSHIPIILLTAKTALENRLAGLQHGADAYLNKPFNTEELIAWIDNLLESRRRLQKKFGASTSTDAMPAPEQGSPAINPLDQQFIKRLYDILEEELDNEQLSAEDLARQMTLSRSQLHRKLTAITGQSVSELLRNYRLDRAMQLLKAGEGNVGEIAWRVGYVNSKHFSTSFKERFGLSPSEIKSTSAG